jgi:hypothetical protein
MTVDDDVAIPLLDAVIRDPAVRSIVDSNLPALYAELIANPGTSMAWMPLANFELPTLPSGPPIRSAWIFVLRANAITGAERHPNSHQRMISYRGYGDFPVRFSGTWISRSLRSDLDAPLRERWVSIPENVWHQGVVGPQDWAVVSFHTATAEELIEERESEELELSRKRYV